MTMATIAMPVEMPSQCETKRHFPFKKAPSGAFLLTFAVFLALLGKEER